MILLSLSVVNAISLELTEEQEKRNLPNHTLKADVKTWWGAAFNRIIEQQELIRIILASDR